MSKLESMKLGIETMFDIDNACQCLKEDEGTDREWTAVGPIGMDDDVEVIVEYVAYCHPSNAALFVKMPELKRALEQVEYQCTQTRIANAIGKTSYKKQVTFLLGELRRIGNGAREALNEFDKACEEQEPLELVEVAGGANVGEVVLIRRGGHAAPSPGQFRYVEATLLEILPDRQAQCRLEQDDPDACHGYCTKKGDIGVWSLSAINRRKSEQ